VVSHKMLMCLCLIRAYYLPLPLSNAAVMKVQVTSRPLKTTKTAHGQKLLADFYYSYYICVVIEKKNTFPGIYLELFSV
jgi:hypothetical protein